MQGIEVCVHGGHGTMGEVVCSAALNRHRGEGSMQSKNASGRVLVHEALLGGKHLQGSSFFAVLILSLGVGFEDGVNAGLERRPRRHLRRRHIQATCPAENIPKSPT